MWDYIAGGAETETTLLRNRLALDQIAFRPRNPARCLQGRLRRIALWQTCTAPDLPRADWWAEAIAENGSVAMAAAASAFGVPFFLSSVLEVTLETVAAAGREGTIVFQLYPRGEAAWIDDHVRRAADAGYGAFCLTVDSAHYSRRERDLANRFGKPWRAKSLGMEFQAALNWRDIARFKQTHNMPLILKGLSTAEDAVLACEHGVEAIVISNHGGRQLDHCQGAMEVLPEIVTAVAGRTKVLIDGGFSRGSDVVKAMALGADGVGIGRLFCYGLAAAGGAGVVRVLELLEMEIVECLGLLGLTSLASLNETYLTRAEPVCTQGVLQRIPTTRSAGAEGLRSFLSLKVCKGRDRRHFRFGASGSAAGSGVIEYHDGRRHNASPRISVLLALTR